MPQRLKPDEVSVLALDTTSAPGHIGAVDIFQTGGDGFNYERLIGLIRERLAYVPRYRQRLRFLPAQLAGPVWVDDEHFDLTFHVRRSALPRPGTLEQLQEFVGRVLARRLDRSRPLWEVYLVEGLADDRFALVSKTHLLLIDGVDGVDLGQVLLEDEQDPPPDGFSSANWHPVPEPSDLELLISSVWEGVQKPELAVENVRGALTGALGTAIAIGETVGGVAGALGQLAGDALRGTRPPSTSPLTGVLSEQRRYAGFSVSLDDLRAVRMRHDHTINDVILAVITGGLRGWLLARGESVNPQSVVRAVVPMSVPEDDGEPTSLGSQVAPHLQSLPVGEANALIRLHQVAYGTRAHKDTGRAVAARSLTDIAGFAPTTIHALGVRVAGEVIRARHDLLITNVPGPQRTMYAAGERLAASYPVLPLTAGHLLAIGVTSYDGEVFFGLTADRDAISDLDVLEQSLTSSLTELLDTTEWAAATRQPTRKRSPSEESSPTEEPDPTEESDQTEETGSTEERGPTEEPGSTEETGPTEDAP